jgi:hypothetical protein
VGQVSGAERPTIAIDGLGQPHIVSDLHNMSEVYIAHRVGGSWTQRRFAQAGAAMGASRVYLPCIVIDRQDRGWVSAWQGVKGFDAGGGPVNDGQGVWLVEDISTAPTMRFLGVANRGKKNGNIAVDPFFPGLAYVVSYGGQFQEFGLDGPHQRQGSDVLDVGTSGEKIRFKIRQRQGGAREGVWHIVMSGWSQESSSYRNSLMDAKVVWASNTVAAYSHPVTGMGDDMRHPGLGVDGGDPKVGYMAVAYGSSVLINIWNGTEMVYDSTDLPVIDSNAAHGGNGGDRFGPQWAPAPGSGAFMCWTSGDNRIKLKRVDPDRRMSRTWDIADGHFCSLALDGPNKNLRLAYINDNRVRYRVLTLGP